MFRAFTPLSTTVARPLPCAVSTLALALGLSGQAAAVGLADQPVFSSSDVPGNLALALSVEWPTASRTAHVGNYASATEYLGYFDPDKCYLYRSDGTSGGATSYFYPQGQATNHTCVGANDDKWSGNFLNWASTATIDPFRWAMTGGRRVVDTATETILEKAWHSGQGELFGNRNLSTSAIGGAVPFNSTQVTIQIDGMGFKMRLFLQGTDSGQRDFTMRVKVCDPSSAAGKLESNCKAYGSNYKPEGLIQKYSDRIRFSAFGYLNDTSDQRDGAVLRARQKFVGPQSPVPRQPAVTNPNAEWSAVDGTFIQNPDSADATATASATGVSVSYSGVMNYLNQFGQLIPGDYKNYDPVSELFYAVMRYYRNLGNVASWSRISPTATDRQRWVDGFPVITNWTDPIQYSCQRNFVLGIGDIYTHVDKDVAGNTTYREREPTMPGEVADDDTVNAVTATNKVGALQGVGNIGSTNSYSGRNNSAYIAGLAYDANTKDIRPDDVRTAHTVGKQTVQTYWVDVLEQSFVANNQFYLAAKYGGMKVPDNFNPYAATTVASTIQDAWWTTNGEQLTDTRTNTSQPKPDNYFAAGAPDTLVAGLTKAFASIANAIKAYTTSFSLAAAQVTGSGNAAYSAQYDAKDWSGVLTGRRLNFAADGTPSTTDIWNSTAKLGDQLAGTGWNTGRRVVSWSGSAGVPFRSGTGGLSAAQLTTLNTSYRSEDDSADYLNYLRGDRTHEGTHYRARSVLLGDIVNAKVTPVGAPQSPYGDAFNPGYTAFKTLWASRSPMVYVAANDGMLHAFNGGLEGAAAGTERFAYVPSALLRGTDGLAELGDPNYVHRYYVDATPLAFDVDFNNAGGSFSSSSNDWRTILVGGLGKGGRSFYAIDVTNPESITTETAAAGKVLWEFTDADTMGYSFGKPSAIKTKKYGWVIVLTSGYNTPNADQQGYVYFIHPRTGALLEKVGTGSAAPGLAHATAYVRSYTDYTADAIYVGDLNGKLWRFDVTQARGTTTAYSAAVPLATLSAGSSTPQPITTPPLIEVSPESFRRFVLVGTGQLLSTTDINSGAMQSFYVIKDGTAGAFSTVSSPITRADMVQNTDVAQGLSVPLSTADKGWFMDFGITDGSAWRMITPSAAYNGTVLFSSLLTVGDACTPAGQSRIYLLNFTTGKTVLTSRQAFQSSPGSVTDLMFVSVTHTTGTGTSQTQTTSTQAVSGGSGGEVEEVKGSLGGGTATKQLNWRELPTLE